MEDLWKFATPKYLKIGKLSSLNIFDYLKNINVKKPLLIADPVLIKNNEVARKIAQQFLDKKLKIFSNFSTNPTMEQVAMAVDTCFGYQPDSIVAMGGGSAIDLAKTAMLVFRNGGKVEEYFSDRKGDASFLPFIVLPTTCGTGSEASPYAVIADKKRNKKRGIENYNFLPTLVIMDSALLISLDKKFIAATALDALTHVMESFISKKANEITRSSVRGLLMSIINNIEKASFEKDEKFLSNMMNVAFSSRLLYPRTGLTITHALSHPLGAYTDIHHGMAVCFFISASFDFNYSYCKKEIDEILNIAEFSNLKDFNKWLADFSKKTGIFSVIQESISKDTLPIELIAKDAMDSSNIPSNPRPVSKQDLQEIVRKSMVNWEIYGT